MFLFPLFTHLSASRGSDPQGVGSWDPPPSLPHCFTYTNSRVLVGASVCEREPGDRTATASISPLPLRSAA